MSHFPKAGFRGLPRGWRGATPAGSVSPGSRFPARLVALALFLALAVCTVATAQETGDTIEQQSAQLDLIKREIDFLKEPSGSALLGYLKQAAVAKQAADSCIKEAGASLQQLNAELATLGPAASGEPPDVASKRGSLEKDKAKVEQRVASCRLLLLGSQELTARVTTLQKAQLAEFLGSRGPNLVEILRANVDDPYGFWSSNGLGLLADSGLTAIGWDQTAVLGALAVLGIALGFALGRTILRRARAVVPQRTLGSGLYRAALACLGYYLPALTASVSVAVYLGWKSLQNPALDFLTQVSYGLTLYFAVRTAIGILLTPRPPAEPWLPFPATFIAVVSRRLQFLALLMLVGFVGYGAVSFLYLPAYVALLARDLFVLLLTLNLAWVIWLLGYLPALSGTRGVRLVLALGFFASLVAEWAGYANLSRFMLEGLVATVLGLGLTLLIARLFSELYDGLDEGRHRWQRRLRHSWHDLGPGEPIPGLIWLRFLSGLLVWSGFTLLALRVWSPVPLDTAVLLGYLTQGFTVGQFKLVPIRIPVALLCFILATFLTGWLKQRLGVRWLKRTRMDRGAREAVVDIVGYAGLGVGVLLALSVTGFDLSKLALIAGALSVGIGFGLQNIVNNFVSGLILLFERPIKRGDWIEVGNVQGFVKNISIRSTQIQTFDRADIIVPNSDLISGQVTNWMLRDSIGRLRVPIGVAYGSDTQRVQRMLVEVAEAHPQVLKDDPFVGPPRVLFLSFGDSSLNFELRCFIVDITQKPTVLSDLNFAIEAACRREGIEIPFPQRDIHLRDWPGGSPPGPGAEAAGPRAVG